MKTISQAHCPYCKKVFPKNSKLKKHLENGSCPLKGMQDRIQEKEG